MLKTSTKLRIDDAYFDLVKQLPLRRLRTQRDHQQAMQMFVKLASRQKDPGTLAYADALATLIGEYERNSKIDFDTSKVTASELVSHCLAERGLSVNAFSKRVGVAQSALSQMLNGKRSWSKLAISRISAFLKIDPSLFLR